MTEHTEQAALFQWAKLMEPHYPGLELLYANPLGGKRPRKTAARMKAEGAKAGIPDITLPVARNGHHGLYIEMKFGKNKPTEKQAWWIEKLAAQGYAVYVCYGWLEARDVLIEYLRGRSEP